MAAAMTKAASAAVRAADLFAEVVMMLVLQCATAPIGGDFNSYVTPAPAGLPVRVDLPGHDSFGRRPIRASVFRPGSRFLLNAYRAHGRFTHSEHPPETGYDWSRQVQEVPPGARVRSRDARSQGLLMSFCPWCVDPARWPSIVRRRQRHAHDHALPSRKTCQRGPRGECWGVLP